MASFLPEPLFETSGRGPATNKNFYQLTATKADVIWRWWKISPRATDRSSKPGELKQSHQDFLEDAALQGEVSLVFGQRILLYVKALCEGHFGYLEQMSDSLLLRIISHLQLEDVGQLGRTSRRFRQLCGSEVFWEQAVRRCCNMVSVDVASLALMVGWRNIFFTSKIQLQKMLSRRRLKAEEEQAALVSDPDKTAAESPDESSRSKQTSSEEGSHHGIIADLSLGAGTGTVDPDPQPRA